MFVRMMFTGQDTKAYPGKVPMNYNYPLNKM